MKSLANQGHPSKYFLNKNNILPEFGWSTSLEASVFYNLLSVDLQSLGQPRLLAPATPATLGDDGALAPHVLRGLDDFFSEDALRVMSEWVMPEGLPTATDREDRWRLASSLQKAIRRGDVAAAMRAAHACHAIDPAYLRKRLVVCAIEDVLLGNLRAVARTLALTGNHLARRSAGELKTAVWLAQALAGGAKDRTACNLILAVDFDRDRHKQTEAMASWQDADLAAWALDLERPLVDRMAATWMLAGTKRFPNLNAPEWNERPRDRLMSLMVASGMPLVLCYIADRAAIRGGGCMHAALLPMWQIIQQDEAKLRFLPGELPDDPGIGQLLSSAYDMHTRQGQAAIIRLMALPEIAEALAQVSPSDRRGAMFEAVFAVEGGRLSSRVSSPQLDSLAVYVDDLVLAHSGVRTLNERRRLLTATAEALPELHRLRREIVLGERKSA